MFTSDMGLYWSGLLDGTCVFGSSTTFAFFSEIGMHQFVHMLVSRASVLLRPVFPSASIISIVSSSGPAAFFLAHDLMTFSTSSSVGGFCMSTSISSISFSSWYSSSQYLLHVSASSSVSGIHGAYSYAALFALLKAYHASLGLYFWFYIRNSA